MSPYVGSQEGKCGNDTGFRNPRTQREDPEAECIVTAPEEKGPRPE